MSRSRWVSSGVLVTLLAFARPAAADGIRWDICTAEGETCDNAIPGRRAQDPEPSEVPENPPDTVPGTCQNAKCLRAGPDGDLVFDCLRCIEIRGSGGGGGTGGHGLGGTDGSAGAGDADSGGSAGATGAAGAAGAGAATSAGGSAGAGATSDLGGSTGTGGSGGSPSFGGAGGAVASGGRGGAGTGGSSSGSGCDCGTAGPMQQRSFAALMLFVGLMALARSRRRQR